MALKDKITEIMHDRTLDYQGKAKEMVKMMSNGQMDDMLPKNRNLPKLKEPLKPKTHDMKILNLSLKKVFFDAILAGTKKIEFRDYTDYYKARCTYTEGGKTYLVAYDALVFHQGNERSMVVALTDITCNGQYFMFHLGKILRPPKKEN